MEGGYLLGEEGGKEGRREGGKMEVGKEKIYLARKKIRMSAEPLGK